MVQSGLVAGSEGTLSKEFESFYSMFIKVFKSLEAELQQGDNRDYAENDIKMRELLFEFEKTPSLETIFPNVVAFMTKQTVSIANLVIVNRS